MAENKTITLTADENKSLTLEDDDKLTLVMKTFAIVGVDDYNLLLNIPKINGVEVKGEKSLDDYDIKKKSEADAQHTAISKSISAEINRAENAEKANSDAISAETTRAQAAEKANADAITTEVSRAKAAEKTNADAIAKETTDRSAAISAETSRAQAAEQANSDAISSHAGNTSNPHSVTAAQTGALPITGGAMIGQIKTSFKNSVAVGSYIASAKTIPDLVQEVRFSSGCMGSANIMENYGSIPSPYWYNFIYIPHGSGGVNGSANEDLCDYGSLILIGMTITNQAWIIEQQSSEIASCFSIMNTDTTYSVATTSENGLMSAADKTKLDNLSSNIGAITTAQIDSITNS